MHVLDSAHSSDSSASSDDEEPQATPIVTPLTEEARPLDHAHALKRPQYSTANWSMDASGGDPLEKWYTVAEGLDNEDVEPTFHGLIIYLTDLIFHFSAQQR